MGSNIKHLLLREIVLQLDSKYKIIHQALENANKAQTDDTKSSAGDKFETTRELMQVEIDKLEGQLIKVKEMQQLVSRIDDAKINDSFVFGSIAITNQANYFLSIGLGKIIIDNEIYYAISPLSPIGNILLDKKKGDIFRFSGRPLEILDII